ncbi:MAG TPA: cupredoxin domain-containing protein [Nitrososphaera sp.]|nr:cupredoxin domain-containing protein [Nitrososphaera sp.]
MSLRNNAIAIVAICCIAVGGLWAIGNLTKETKEADLSHVEGVLLLAERNTFNDTNPSISVNAGVPAKLVVVNKDIVKHDLQITGDKTAILNINTLPLNPEQSFPTAILAYKPGTYEYYCSFHPAMRGKIIAS